MLAHGEAPLPVQTLPLGDMYQTMFYLLPLGHVLFPRIETGARLPQASKPVPSPMTDPSSRPASDIGELHQAIKSRGNPQAPLRPSMDGGGQKNLPPGPGSSRHTTEG